MMTPEFIQNSGIAGVADMVLKTYAGKKMDEKARKLQADAEARRMTAQEGVDDRKAEKDATRAEAASTRERSRRSMVAQQMGLNRREAAEYVETGKVPNAVRGVPMMTNQGLVIVNPETDEYVPARPMGQQAPANVRIDPSMSPEDQAIARADAATRGDPSGETVDYGQIQRPGQAPLMPYKDPAIEAQQAATNARLDRADRRDQARLEAQQNEDARKQAEAAAAANARQASAAGTAQDLIDTIDRLTSSDGYSSLGTATGDLLTNIPVIRTDAKDAQRTLDTISGKVALQTMAQLRALSTAGATGFGALSKEELNLLRNSISALEAGGLSHKTLDANLKVIRDKMAKVTGWKPESQSPSGGLSPQEQQELDALRKRFGK